MHEANTLEAKKSWQNWEYKHFFHPVFTPHIQTCTHVPEQYIQASTCSLKHPKFDFKKKRTKTKPNYASSPCTYESQVNEWTGTWTTTSLRAKRWGLLSLKVWAVYSLESRWVQAVWSQWEWMDGEGRQNQLDPEKTKVKMHFRIHIKSAIRFCSF